MPITAATTREASAAGCPALPQYSLAMTADMTATAAASGPPTNPATATRGAATSAAAPSGAGVEAKSPAVAPIPSTSPNPARRHGESGPTTTDGCAHSAIANNAIASPKIMTHHCTGHIPKRFTIDFGLCVDIEVLINAGVQGRHVTEANAYILLKSWFGEKSIWHKIELASIGSNTFQPRCDGRCCRSTQSTDARLRMLHEWIGRAGAARDLFAHLQRKIAKSDQRKIAKPFQRKTEKRLHLIANRNHSAKRRKPPSFRLGAIRTNPGAFSERLLSGFGVMASHWNILPLMFLIFFVDKEAITPKPDKSVQKKPDR